MLSQQQKHFTDLLCVFISTVSQWRKKRWCFRDNKVRFPWMWCANHHQRWRNVGLKKEKHALNNFCEGEAARAPWLQSRVHNQTGSDGGRVCVHVWRCNPVTLGSQVSSRCADMMRGLLRPCSHSEISTYFMCVLKYLHQSACLHLSLQPCARPCFLQQHRSNVSTARKSTHPSVSNCFYFSLLLHSCFSLRLLL